MDGIDRASAISAHLLTCDAHRSWQRLQTAFTIERIMSANQQVGRGLLGVGNWTLKPSTAGSGKTQASKSARRPTLTAIFARSIDEPSIADGDLFRHFLSMERKRSERSGKSFMLVVLRVDIPHGLDERKVLGPLQRRIFSSIRSTDLVGWYDYNQRALGILFAEIAEPDQVTASATLTRVTEAISAHTAPELLKMDVTCHVFQSGKSNDSRSVEPCAAGD